MSYVAEVCSKVNVYEQPYCFYLGSRTYPVEIDNPNLFILIMGILLFVFLFSTFIEPHIVKWLDKKEKEIKKYHEEHKYDDDWF